MTTASPITTTADLIREGILAIGDGYRAKNSELSDAGIPFARAGNVDRYLDFSAADRFPVEALDRVGEKISRPGDTVFTSKGTVGRFAFVRGCDPAFVYSPQLSYWRSLQPDRLDPRYLHYWLQGREFWIQAAGVKGQTDMADYVSLTDQRRMRITVPPIQVQRGLGRTLGTLDDKIDLNREMHGTLEAMAQAIFRSWFVDFDPVVAKSEGREPFGMDAETAALFPDRFVESELGPIPEGWEVSPVGSEVTVVGGSTPSTKQGDFWEGGTIPWTTPKDLSEQGSAPLLWTARRITEAGLARISSGLLPVGTVLLSSRAPVGYTAIAAVPLAINQGYIAMRCEGRVGTHYCFWWTRENMPEIESRAGGTTFAEISKKAFRPIPMLVPPSSVLNRWEALASPLFDLVVANLRESQTLAALRDLLLPKLLSGEIRVPEAAEMVEDVV